MNSALEGRLNCLVVHVQATVRDLYRRKELGVFQGSFTGAVLLHGVLALKVTPLQCACTASPMPPPGRCMWLCGCSHAPSSG